MSAANVKKYGSTNPANAYAGAMARLRRRGTSSRAGRRSVMLGVLSALQSSGSRSNTHLSSRGPAEA
ncbi:MAG: hypothetical protein KatS3mg108_1087 [Isosphaeraceae bacterium]|jgi:hypothetical protein|nr:MAG: hypothetical protein KatS3mg108_1087 [Isosphaeraceae bacterium]